MHDLAQRLAALDPQASTAVRVISHFDALVASRAGLQSIVRGAATLAGCPARLVDPARRLTVRVLANGVTAPPETDPDPAWPSTPVTADGAALWLETTTPAGTVEAVVLERAAAAAQTILERTRSRRHDDPASIELLLDAEATEADRLIAARRLGSPSKPGSSPWPAATSGSWRETVLLGADDARPAVRGLMAGAVTQRPPTSRPGRGPLPGSPAEQQNTRQ